MNSESNILIHELRATLGKMELALGTINEAIVWTDFNGAIQWCNTSFDELVGRIRLINLGKSLYDILPLQKNRQELPAAAHPLHLALRTGNSEHGVYEFIRQKKRRTIELSINLLSMASAEQSAIVVLHDISDIEELEQFRLQGAALAAAANAIAITNVRGEIEWINPSFMALTGYDLDAVYGKTMRILKSGRQDSSFYEELWQTIERGEVWKGVLVNRRADGTEYFEEQTITPVQDAGGAVSHYIAIKSDVTEKILYQKELDKLEAKKSAILSGVVDGIVTITTDGVIESINPACESMFGYKSGELKGKDVTLLMPQPHKQLHETYISKYLQTRIPRIIGYGRELEAVHKDGRLFPIELSISEIRLEDETLFTAVIRDITARKVYERQMHKMNNMLLENQRKLSEDLTAAAQIQKTLLPQEPPTLPHLSMAWRFKPSAYVSGDIFNYFMLDDETLAVYLLDVSGHGVPAAMIALNVSQLLHPDSRFVEQAWVDGSFSPGRLLELLDNEFPIERFEKHFTIIFMTINTRTGQVLYSNAGHPYPVHCSVGGNLTDLECGGTIIGLGNIVPFTEGALELGKGERIFLFTDGVIEREAKSGEQFGLDRLRRVLSESTDVSLDTATDRLYGEVLHFERQKAPIDDVTIVAVELFGEWD